MIRIGHGMDVHRLVEALELVLCGVKIPHERGLLGHSDADVATHALMDALLGAACLGDIGKHFPDTDKAYKGARSVDLLKLVGKKLENEGYVLRNADITIVAQEPKLSPYIEDMRQCLATALRVPVALISVKATTTEHLGFEGQEQGISAHAVCLIRSITDRD